MMNQIYATRNYNLDHSTFTGRIYQSDFDGHATMCSVASRIVADWNFDKQCRKNAEYRDRKQITKGEK